jgi:hypothetical protein
MMTLKITRDQIRDITGDLKLWQIPYWPFRRLADGYEITVGIDQSDARTSLLLLKYKF